MLIDRLNRLELPHWLDSRRLDLGEGHLVEDHLHRQARRRASTSPLTRLYVVSEQKDSRYGSLANQTKIQDYA